MGLCSSSSSKNVAVDGLDTRRRSVDLRLSDGGGSPPGADISPAQPNPGKPPKKKKMSPSKLYEVTPKMRKLYRLEDLKQGGSGGSGGGGGAVKRRPLGDSTSGSAGGNPASGAGAGHRRAETEPGSSRERRRRRPPHPEGRGGAGGGAPV